MRETTNQYPNGEEMRIFVVCYPNGNLHSTTANQEIAYATAYRIDGIIGELTNVHKPLKEEDIPEPVRSAIIHSIEQPESRSRRQRPAALRSTGSDIAAAEPMPKTTAIDDHRSDGHLDQPNAA